MNKRGPRPGTKYKRVSTRHLPVRSDREHREAQAFVVRLGAMLDALDENIYPLTAASVSIRSKASDALAALEDHIVSGCAEWVTSNIENDAETDLLDEKL